MKITVFDKENGEKSPEIELGEFISSCDLDIMHWHDSAACFPDRY